MKKLARLIKCSIFVRLYWRTIFRNINNKLKKEFTSKGRQLKLPIKTKNF